MEENLFERIILAVKQEKEFKNSRNLLFLFSALFVISFVILPFSFSFFISEWRGSGISYFIALLFFHAAPSFSLLQDIVLSILESVPVMGITLFALNVALFLFTVRLFLFRKAMLLKYLKHL